MIILVKIKPKACLNKNVLKLDLKMLTEMNFFIANGREFQRMEVVTWNDL